MGGLPFDEDAAESTCAFMEIIYKEQVDVSYPQPSSDPTDPCQHRVYRTRLLCPAVQHTAASFNYGGARVEGVTGGGGAGDGDRFCLPVSLALCLSVSLPLAVSFCLCVFVSSFLLLSPSPLLPQQCVVH
eukprot:987718-Rhodomonas_salina.1